MSKATKGRRANARNPAARLAFFARKDEIAKALEGGAYMNAVFDELNLPGSYSQFVRYVRGHVMPLETPSVSPVEPPPLPSGPPAASGALAADATPPGPNSSGPLRARAKPERPIYDPSKIKPEDLY